MLVVGDERGRTARPCIADERASAANCHEEIARPDPARVDLQAGHRSGPHELARDGDVVVIAGKGHEQGQEFAYGRKLPFDDVTVAREALRARLVA